MSANNKSLKIERTFDAPRDAVWNAWTIPEELSQWWSPDTFIVSKCEIDLCPDGKLILDMTGPDGTVYPMRAIYKEVVEPEKLVFISSVLDNSENVIFQIRHTILFSEKDKKTNVVMDWDVISTTPEAEQYLSGMETGLNQSLQKLEKFLK